MKEKVSDSLKSISYSVITKIPPTMEARKNNGTFVCVFCNAIVATRTGTQEAFVSHMEDIHKIQVNLNVVMALHFYTDEEKENFMRKKRVNLLHFFGLKIDAGEDETTQEQEEENPPKLNYPKMRAKPNEKESEFLKRRLSA